MNSANNIEGKARPLTPILRWAGGKRWLAPAVHEVSHQFSSPNYIEPFVGGGAVFFGSDWTEPIIGDSNRALIMCYKGIAEDPHEVRRLLKRLPIDSKTYHQVARMKPRKPTTCAARLLYLNRAAYGGIYRENKKGEFNVPFSGDRTLASLVAGTRLEEVGRVLDRATVLTGDFEATMEYARPGALIYCDPPYSLPGGETSFRRYGNKPFNWADQRRLASACRRHAQNGCIVIISNSSDEIVRELYRTAEVVPVSRRTTLGRGRVGDQKEAVYVMHESPSVAEKITTVLQETLS